MPSDTTGLLENKISITLQGGFTLNGTLTSIDALKGQDGFMVKLSTPDMAVWCPSTSVIDCVPCASRTLMKEEVKHQQLRETDTLATARLFAIADAYEAFARRLQTSDGLSMASFAYFAAAEIDRMNAAASEGFGGPFNGQRKRQELFWKLVERLHTSVFVETGTHRGTTTEYVAETLDGAIFACEVNPRYLDYARRRLSKYANVTVDERDSRQFLEQLLQSGSLKHTSVIFYLDAHWNDDLPLEGELSLILNSGLTGVILVDDFEVPFDPGYKFDEYGTGKRLCLELLHPHKCNISGLYFPRVPSAEETGLRRGAAIIAIDPMSASTLSTFNELRPWPI